MWQRKVPRLILGALLLGGLAFISFNPRPLAIGDKQRVMVWSAAVKSLINEPRKILFGFGAEGFENVFRRYKLQNWTDFYGADVADDAHNDFLQILVTCGLLGLLAYLNLAYQVFKSLKGPALGAMAALFVNLKLNPAALETLVVAAIICGSVKKLKPLPMWGRALFLVFSLAIAGITTQIARADYYNRKNDLISLKKACEINPYEINYKIMFQNEAIRQFNRSNNLELRTFIVRDLRRQAESALIHRPNFSNSWHFAGNEALIEQKLGISRDPARYFKKAISMDPYNPPLLEVANKK